MLKLLRPVLRTKINRKFDRFNLPYKVNLHITYSCNSRCKTCFIWEKYRKKPELKDRELKTDQWKRFFENLGDRLYWVSIGGGEPFMRDDLVGIVSSMNTKNLCVLSINTNGQLTEKIYKTMKELLDMIPENVRVFLAVSLLGYEDTHNLVSGKENAFKTSEKTYKKLESLQTKYENLYLERELVVNKYNVNEMHKIAEKLNEEKIPFTLTFSQESDYYDNMGKNVGLSSKERKLVANILKNLRIPRYQRVDIIKEVFKKTAIKFFESGEIPKCYSSWCSVRIDPYGNVHPIHVS